LAGQMELAVMRIHQHLRDRESESAAAGGVRARGVGAVEPLEQTWQVLRRTAASGVSDLYNRGVCVSPNRYVDSATFRCVLRRAPTAGRSGADSADPSRI